MAGRQKRKNSLRDFCVTLSRTYVHLWLFDCSERQRKQQCLKELPCSFGHGVLGVECSNHSVPTILFNDLAQLLRVGLFHVRDFCGTSPRFMPQICLFCPPPPACQPTMLCLPLRLVAQPLGRLTGDACRWSCIRFSRTATARRGSESMRSFWQFKSFPVSMPFKHF